MFDFTYLIIIVGVLILSPFAIAAATRTDKKTKQILRFSLFVLLVIQIVTGFFNWESSATTNRSGIALAAAYPSSLLGLFFIIPFFQAGLLLLRKHWALVTTVVLNFVNTVVFFIGVVSLEKIRGIEVFSYFALGAIFAVLVGNVVALLLVNRDKNLAQPS